MKKVSVTVAIAGLLFLAGCASNPFTTQNLTNVSNKIATFNANVSRIAPVVGKDVILIGDALVQVECSPAMQLATQGVKAAIAVTGTTNATALQAQAYLQTNSNIADALCPVYQGIKASIVAQVGALPTTTPSQTIAIPATPVKGS